MLMITLNFYEKGSVCQPARNICLIVQKTPVLKGLQNIQSCHFSASDNIELECFVIHICQIYNVGERSDDNVRNRFTASLGESRQSNVEYKIKNYER